MDEERKEYLEERHLLIHLEAEAYKSFDKILLTLSSGAIILSLTFINKPAKLIHLYLVVLSWIFWTISIFFQIISCHITAKATRREQAILNKQYKNENDTEDSSSNQFSGWPTKINTLTFISFGIGVILFIIFASINLN